MPNLRELLQNVCSHDEIISQSTYALLKALVEVIDGGEHTCEECKFFNPWDVLACRNTAYFGGRRTTAMSTICDEFEALPVMEPEKHTCGECGFFREHSGCRNVDDRDDDEWASRFYYTDPGSPACRNFVQSGDTQIATRNLHKELTEVKAECRWLITKNDEAKAELKRLRKERALDESVLLADARKTINILRKEFVEVKTECRRQAKENDEAKMTIKNLRDREGVLAGEVSRLHEFIHTQIMYNQELQDQRDLERAATIQKEAK